MVTSPGPPWISTDSHPDDFPFLASIGGEIVRVVSVSGAQSPQTFVVERGVNGGALSHPMGSAVSLAVVADIAR